VQAVGLHVVARPFEGKNASLQLALQMKRGPACNRIETDDALYVTWLCSDPVWGNVCDDPRFKELLKRPHLPQMNSTNEPKV
jgi:hypothetical protein